MNQAMFFLVSAALVLTACSASSELQETAPRPSASAIAPGAANAESVGAEPVPMTWTGSGDIKRERRKVILQAPQRPAAGTGM